jgi:type II restriction/modification system DNA methylase subunit YeeA
MTIGDLEKLPIPDFIENKSIGVLVDIAQHDWDSYETSWDFEESPLLESDGKWSFKDGSQKLTSGYFPLKNELSNAFAQLREGWQENTLEMQRQEEENNRIFIEAYGLEAELEPDVPLNEITLTCNPYYRYGVEAQQSAKGEFPVNADLEAKLLADTLKEFISYAVGCMFGRFALEKPGLVLANQGETIEDYLKQIPEPLFMADDDNVIPMLDEGWFSDDITERFFEFLRVTFGSENFDRNLRFIEAAIGKDVRKYFLKDFYPDHLKRYKKRPVYWLFSSPKGSFNALVYMHRYRSDTVSIVLNDYLREFRTKLSARIDHLQRVDASADSSKSEKNKALKDIDRLKKVIEELDAYERETLYPLAVKKIEIDLDDGVKVNYPKFGDALKKIPGLESREEE